MIRFSVLDSYLLKIAFLIKFPLLFLPIQIPINICVLYLSAISLLPALKN